MGIHYDQLSKREREAIRPAVKMYTRCPLSLRQAGDGPLERGIDIGHDARRSFKNGP